MTCDALAKSYLIKARARLKIIELLLADKEYSDVVRVAQETVELATKAMLRQVGIEPPKWHDVGTILIEHAELFSDAIQANLARVATISKALRKERELSFYGDEDFVPTESYTDDDAQDAAKKAIWVVDIAQETIKTVR